MMFDIAAGVFLGGALLWACGRGFDAMLKEHQQNGVSARAEELFWQSLMLLGLGALLIIWRGVAFFLPES